MITRILKIILLSIFISVFILSSFRVLGQEECATKKECESLLKKYEEQIAKYEEDISKTQKEKKTLRNQVSILKSKIEKLKLQIQQSNMLIKDLNAQVKDTEGSIEKTTLKIKDSREKLADILKAIYEEDQKSTVEILLSNERISDFFNNLMVLENLNFKNQEILENIKGLKDTLKEQKENLEEEKEDIERIVKVQTLQKQQNEESKKEQERIFKMTEAKYQQYLKEKKELEKKAAEIMTRIAQLTLPGLDVPKTRKELYELASWAGKSAGGVRPALILGLIEVESALGTNVGQCNCADQSVCRHPELSYKRVMSSKEWSAFEVITRELGYNLTTTPVSCYVNGGKVQMGGAMGPAQFMPNTWLKLGYKQRIEDITGIKPANPWRASDAFLATALYLSDWNAKTQNRQSEIGAVTAYLCGTSAMTSRCQKAGGAYYSSLVMQKADQWQDWINQGI